MFHCLCLSLVPATSPERKDVFLKPLLVCVKQFCPPKVLSQKIKTFQALSAKIGGTVDLFHGTVDLFCRNYFKIMSTVSQKKVHGALPPVSDVKFKSEKVHGALFLRTMDLFCK